MLHRSGPSRPNHGCREIPGSRNVSTVGALKHTAVHAAVSMTARISRCGRCQMSSLR